MVDGSVCDASNRRGQAAGRRRRGSWFVTTVACASIALLATSCSSSADTGSAGGTTATTVAPQGVAWPVYGHDLANTRENAAETEIDPDSVGSLTRGWSKDGLVGVTGTPVTVGTTAYFGDWQGTVWAVDAGSGRTLWTTKLPGGVVVGSPSVSGGHVFVALGKTLYSLDRTTGRVVWQTVVNPNPYSQISASPVVTGNLVLQGTAQVEEVVGHAPFTFRGTIGAFDVATGKQVWNFYTTPNDATSGAGEGVWSTPAVDPSLGLLYVGTGQNLSDPSGPLADSILAIDLHTGLLKWSHQFNHPDIFSTANYSGKDADVGASPNLWTAGGHKMVGVGSKNGTYYALDRATGKLRWETFLTHGSTFGGVLGSSAVADGRIIASSNIGDPTSNATTNTSKVFALDPATGRIRWQRSFAGNVFGPVSAVPGVAFLGTDAGMMSALSIANGTTLWSFTAPDKVGGGPSIVGGRVLWGYGFTLFKGPGKGGIISFTVSAAGRVRSERGGTATDVPGSG
jgi:polyvinyl alcohol dehydrogenase (cytochrome)